MAELIKKSAFEHRLKVLRIRYAYMFREPSDMYSIMPGWFDLIVKLCVDIHDALEVDELRRCFRFSQIGEKFGGLRIYWSASCEFEERLIDRLDNLIEAAERRSTRTCMFCGAPGRLNMTSGWLKTVCAQHAGTTWHDWYRS